MKTQAQRLTTAVGCALAVLCGLLGGCTPADDTPTSTPVIESTPAPTAPAVEPTPTPLWSPEEQAAIDIVFAYIELGDHISQNLSTADWGEIRTVSSDPAANHLMQLWFSWNERGWHQTGETEFTAYSSHSAKTDERGDYYYVRGCYSIANVVLVDSTGTQTDAERAGDAYPSVFTVLHAANGQFYVIEDVREEGPC